MTRSKPITEIKIIHVIINKIFVKCQFKVETIQLSLLSGFTNIPTGVKV